MITEILGPSLEELKARSRKKKKKKKREGFFVNVLRKRELLPMRAVLRVTVCVSSLPEYTNEADQSSDCTNLLIIQAPD